jgi:transcriptional regulator GlxA family with amidase domain
MEKELHTLIIIYPGCIAQEVMLAAELLEDRFPIIVATHDKRPLRLSNGLNITPDYLYGSVPAESVGCVLIPGGDPASVAGNKSLDELLCKVHGQGAVLASICAGAFLLGKAGLLSDKKIAHGWTAENIQFLRENGYFENTEFTDESLICEGQLVTARPEAHIEFALEVAYQMKIVPTREEVKKYIQYYKGKRF